LTLSEENLLKRYLTFLVAAVLLVLGAAPAGAQSQKGTAAEAT
jgi:hypothetical protein